MSIQLSARRSLLQPFNLLDSLAREPGRWQFAQAVRVLLKAAHYDPLQLQLYSDTRYGYHRAEVTDVEKTARGWRLTTTLPALTGREGTLPHAYQDLAEQCRASQDNSAMADFFQLFNQRVLLQSYRIATGYRLHLIHEQEHATGQMRLNRLLCAIAGIPAPQHLPAEHLVRFAGLLGSRSRSPRVLQQILQDYFGYRFGVTGSTVSRQAISTDALTRLGSGALANNRLGDSAAIGSATWLQDKRLKVHIIAADARQLEKIRWDRKLTIRIKELCRLFIGQMVQVDLTVQCCSKLLSNPTLSAHSGRGARLGRYDLLNPTALPDTRCHIALQEK